MISDTEIVFFPSISINRMTRKITYRAKEFRILMDKKTLMSTKLLIGIHVGLANKKVPASAMAEQPLAQYPDRQLDRVSPNKLKLGPI